MALIDDVKAICDRLAPLGWRELLLRVTDGQLDIARQTPADLVAELTKNLSAIDRTVPGFEDFYANASSGTTAGQPARSLLYHALAAPDVHPETTNADPTEALMAYPSLAELDTLENFIYSFRSDRQDLRGTFISVFAYQYRPASGTTHLRCADFAYSRTGVARVGTSAAHYDRSRRSFWVLPADGSDKICVMPARFAAFVARREKPGVHGTVHGAQPGDDDEVEFVFPVHKLFDGKECLNGKDIHLSFAEFHRNEKLRRTHEVPTGQGGLAAPRGFNIKKFPYVRDSLNGGNLISLERVGASVLVVPTPSQQLVRTVTQRNQVTKNDQIVYFKVPRGNDDNRYAGSSFTIPSQDDDRLAPEYINIRHAINPAGPATQLLQDLNLLAPRAFTKMVHDGHYFAAHFTDDSCDGCVEPVIRGYGGRTERRPAFSLVTAPDFLPLADQFALAQDPGVMNAEPLCLGRLPVNPTLPRVTDHRKRAFAHNDTTVTAVVGASLPMALPALPTRPSRAVSFLPDAASNVFAPGWDTSKSRDRVGEFLTTYGLGSPFPEDAKLCAALMSFWPAVAPDAGRTFGNEGDYQNQIPMLDSEVGYHPQHLLVQSGAVKSYRGWDGEFGPFFEQVNGQEYVNHAAIERSDYVSNALNDHIRISLTAEVQGTDLSARYFALLAANAILSEQNAAKRGSLRCLVVVQSVSKWTASNSGLPQLSGGGVLFEFADMEHSRVLTKELTRVRRKVLRRYVCQIGTNGIAFKAGDSAFQFFPL